MICGMKKLVAWSVAGTLCIACTGTVPNDDESIDVGVIHEALEFACLFAGIDATAELGPRFPNGREILTTEPYDTSLRQDYGSFGCSGFVADFTNPNGYNINRILVAGAGWVEDASDFNVYGTEALCASLTLEADVYGYRNGVSESLGSVVLSGDFRPNDGPDGEDRCHLSYQIVQAGNYEVVRIVGRVSNQTTTYPFRVNVG